MRGMRRILAVGMLALAGLVGLAACSDEGDTTGADAAAGADAGAGSVSVLGADQAAEEIAAGDTVVIDVRTPEEYASGHVEDAVNVNVEAGGFLERAEAELDEGDTVLVYCRTGNRSAAAADQLAAAGWTVLDAGGLADLAAAGAPVTGSTG